jgi:outer membrane protein assembly factor BamB
VPAGGDRTVDVAVRPASASGPLGFVVASDTHAGIAGMPAEDQAFALEQATSIEPRPHFIAVTGDITQSNRPEQFAIVKDAIAAIDTPYVPVPGNHDWYDGGAAYRLHFGPPSYAFNAGGVHFIVLNDADSLAGRLAFVARDLAILGAKDATIVALMHAPPGDDLVAPLAAHGVDMLLTGHLHANRVLVHDALVEYNTQPLAMGGIDLTPAGYRLITLDAAGELRVEHRTIVNQPLLRIVSPVPGQLVEPCRVPIVVALEAGAAVESIQARAGDVRAPLAHQGAWTHASEPLALCDPGAHRVAVEATLAGGGVLRDEVEFVVGQPLTAGTIEGAAPEVELESALLEGMAVSSTAERVAAGDSFESRWVSSLGGHVASGAPVLADGRLYVPVSDFADGAAGGVVALDSATGETLWQARVGFSVRSAVAAAAGVVVFAANDGTVHAVDAASGDELWSYTLAADVAPAWRSIYSAPVIADGVVFAGVRSELAALQLHTGQLLWSVVPIESPGYFASHATPVVAMGRLIVAFDRGDQGLMAFDTETGQLVWQTGALVVQGMQGSPTISGDVAIVVNELTEVRAIGLASGATRWSTRLDERAFTWGHHAVATPADGDGQVFVATQLGELYALDADNGRVRWSAKADRALVRTSHYTGETPAFGAAPAVTAGAIWAGSPDGMLRALTSDGRELAAIDLGVPITASPVLDGRVVYVASYDGTVRALAAADRDRTGGGCGVGGRGPGPAGALALAIALLVRRRLAPARDSQSRIKSRCRRLEVR